MSTPFVYFYAMHGILYRVFPHRRKDLIFIIGKVAVIGSVSTPQLHSQMADGSRQCMCWSIINTFVCHSNSFEQNCPI